MTRPLAVLINPPVYDFAFFDLHLKPYGLLRLARWLERAGYGVAVVDCLDHTDPASIQALGRPLRKADGTGKLFRVPADTPAVLRTIRRRFARYGVLPQSLESKLASLEPDIVFTATTMTYWYRGLIEVVEAVRRLHPRTPIVVGGPYVTLCPDHASRSIGADHIVIGDVWPTLAPILQGLGLPVPAGPPADEILLDPKVLRGSAPLRLNRGCPFQCAYCASPILTGGLQVGDREHAFRVLMELHRELGIKNFAFYDDALLANKDEVLKPFLRRVIGQGLAVTFAVPNALHLSLLDSETALLMRQAGFSEVRLGYESASQAFHKTMDQKVDPGMLGEGAAMLRAAGFSGQDIIAYVLAGLPGQHEEEVTSTLETIRGHGIRVSIAEFSPIPGTPLWGSCVEKSSYPLEEEPLFHNNSIQPMAWQGLSAAGLQRIKHHATHVSAEAW